MSDQPTPILPAVWLRITAVKQQTYTRFREQIELIHDSGAEYDDETRAWYIGLTEDARGAAVLDTLIDAVRRFGTGVAIDVTVARQADDLEDLERWWSM